MSENTIKIGFLTISDRASRGVYEDISGPAIQEWISKAVTNPYKAVSRIIEDERMTTLEAHTLLRAAGKSPSKARGMDRGKIDSASAAIILNSYIESK